MHLVEAEPDHSCTVIIEYSGEGFHRGALECGAPAVVCNLDEDGPDFLCEDHRHRPTRREDLIAVLTPTT